MAKVISAEHKEVVYTLELTQKEINAIVLVIGNISGMNYAAYMDKTGKPEELLRFADLDSIWKPLSKIATHR